MTRTKISLEYFGMEGEGATVKEAKLDAGSKIEALVRESGTPTLVGPCNGHCAIMWRDKYGWAYSLLPDAGKEPSSLCAHHEANRDECYDSAASHLAQCYCDCDEVMTVADVPAFVTSRRGRMEQVSYNRWQRAARHAQRLGLDSNQVHAWACQHETEFTNKKSTGEVLEVLAVA